MSQINDLFQRRPQLLAPPNLELLSCLGEVGDAHPVGVRETSSQADPLQHAARMPGVRGVGFKVLINNRHTRRASKKLVIRAEYRCITPLYQSEAAGSSGGRNVPFPTISERIGPNASNPTDLASGCANSHIRILAPRVVRPYDAERAWAGYCWR